jgi:hypothetical protein
MSGVYCLLATSWQHNVARGLECGARRGEFVKHIFEIHRPGRAIANPLQVYAGSQVNGGGVTRINEVSQDNPARYTRIYIGGAAPLDPITQVNLRLGRDLTVRNGLKTEYDLVLRLIKLF